VRNAAYCCLVTLIPRLVIRSIISVPTRIIRPSFPTHPVFSAAVRLTGMQRRRSIPSLRLVTSPKLQQRDMVELVMHDGGGGEGDLAAVALLEERGKVVVHEGGWVLKGLCMKRVGGGI
jgi:hypothetical protein